MTAWGERYRIEIPIVVDNRAARQFQQVQVQVHAMERSAQRARGSFLRMMGPWRAQMSLVDRVTSPLRMITRTLGLISRPVTIPLNITGNALRMLGTRGPLDVIGKRVTGIAQGLLATLQNPKTFVTGALATGIAGAAFTYPLTLAADLERATTAFRTMFKSIEEGKGQMVDFAQATKLSSDFIGDLQEFSRKTPFEFPNLVDAATKLATVGYEGGEILTMMKGIGDAVAGLGGGVEQIDRIVLAFAQIRQTGKLQGDELRQLYEARIPALKLLTRGLMQEQEERRSKGLKLGETEIKSQAQLQKMIIAGVVPAERALRIITEQMSKEWPDMMKEQSRTMRGLWSTIRETFNLRIILPFGQGLAEVIQPRLAALVDWLDANKGALDRVATGIKAFGRAIAQFVVGPVERAIKGLGSLFANPAFQNASLGRQIGMIFESFLGQATQRMGIFGTVVREMATNFLTAFNAILRVIPIVVGWIMRLSAFLDRELGPAVSTVSKSLRDNLGKTFKFYFTSFVPTMIKRFEELFSVIAGGKVTFGSLAKVFTGGLRGGIMWLATTGIPAFFGAIERALKWVAGPGMDALIRLAGWIKEHVSPAFAEGGKNAKDGLGKAWEAIVQFWDTRLKPALKDLKDFVAKDVKGAMERAGYFISEEFIPALEKVVTFLKEKLPPAIKVVGEFIDEKLKPALKEAKDLLDGINATLDRFGKEQGPGMLSAWQGITAWMTETGVPALESLWTWLDQRLGTVINWYITEYLPALGSLFKTIGDRVHDFGDFLARVGEKMQELGTYQAFVDIMANLKGIWTELVTLTEKLVKLFGTLLLGAVKDLDKTLQDFGGNDLFTKGMVDALAKQFDAWAKNIAVVTGAVHWLLQKLNELIDFAVKNRDLIAAIMSGNPVKIKEAIDEFIKRGKPGPGSPFAPGGPGSAGMPGGPPVPGTPGAPASGWPGVAGMSAGDYITALKKWMEGRPAMGPEAGGAAGMGYPSTWNGNPAPAAFGRGGYEAASEMAIMKGLDLVGNQKYVERGANNSIITYCLKFVDDMFGSLKRHNNAAQAGDALAKDTTTAIQDVVRGQLLFFKADPTNSMQGHVAIALGQGAFLHSAGKGVEIIQPGDASYKYWQSMYKGSGAANIAIPPAPVGAGVGASGGAGDYRTMARQAAEQYRLNADIFERQIQAESGFNPNAGSPAGARGIAQFMPGTGASVAKQLGVSEAEFWASPQLQLQGAARHMRDLMDKFNQDYGLALAAYNAGEGAVRKAGGIPLFKETQNYVSKIMAGNAQGAGRGGGPGGGEPTPTVINLVFPSVTNLNEADARVFAKRIWEALADEGASRIDEVAANLQVK